MYELRLDLPVGEAGPITAELERILQYMDQLAELDTPSRAWAPVRVIKLFCPWAAMVSRPACTASSGETSPRRMAASAAF